MAKPSPKDALPLYPSEERIVREVFGDAADEMMRSWRETAQVLERNGLPKRDPLFGYRRYWPAVERWFNSYNGVSSDRGAYAPDGEENWS